MGTYDDAWLKERWPYFPVDFDWSYFNCAPPDQQLANYLSGDEMLYFENLHPERAHLHCQLPGIRVRVFVNNEAGGRVHFSEVNLNIDTLWVAPEVGRLHLIWRGLIEVQDEKMEEVAHCLVVSEQLDQPSKTVEDYRHVLSARLEGEFEDSDTTPPVMEVEAVDDSWIKGMEEEFVRLEKEMAAIDKKADASGKKLQAILAGEGSRPSGETPSSPPSFDEAMNNSSEFERQLLESHPELAKLLPKKMAPAAAAGIDDFMAFDDSPADADTELFPVPMTRDECRMRTETSKDFEGEDLFGLDLSELDFSDCNCRGANFEAAILAGAAFSRADLTGARFPGCSLVAVDFSGAKLVEADCTAADLTSAKLDSAVVDNSDFSYAVMEYASLVGTSGFRAIFVNANLNGATLVNARMVEADFEAASLVAADFTEADLTGTSVEGAQGPQVKMISANLTGLQASEGADFSNGLFRSVHAPESIWEGAVLEGADFSAADLARADFAQSSLKKARFSGSDLTMARFEDADLTEAVMTGVNFFQGSLEQAKLNRTDLRSSNCYEVEFYRAEIVDAQFGGAVLTMTKLAGGKER